MSVPDAPVRIVACGFDIDERAGELRKGGLTVRLPQQLFRLLVLLMEHPGRVVTRNEIRSRLWSDRFVDFDDAINSAIKRIRRSLERSGANPQMIETLPGHGYRFASPPEPGSPLRANAEAPEVSRPALAVLPLQDLSVDSEGRVLASSLTDALITVLAKIPKLRLKLWSGPRIASSFDHRILAAAKKMKINAVLMGTVLRSGNNARVTVQLADVATTEYLWAANYDFKCRDMLVFCSDASGGIAEQVASKLVPGHRQHSRTFIQTRRPAAYQAFLKGHDAFKNVTDDGLWKARHYWKKAVREDPDYARAYAGLAESYNMLAISGLMPATEALVQARDAAKRALELDESLSEGHTALGFTLMLEWNWDDAGREFSRALQLDPNLASGNPCHYVEYLLALGRPETATTELERAQEFQPLSLFLSVILGWAYYGSGQYDKAIRQHRRVLAMDPQFGMAHWCLGLDYSQKRRYKAAIEAFHAAKLLGGSRNVLASIGYAYAMMGNDARAQQVLKELKQLHKASYSPPYGFAAIYSGLGETDAAFEWLARAYEAHDVGLIWLKWDPQFSNLRSDFRLQELLSNIGLVTKVRPASAAD